MNTLYFGDSNIDNFMGCRRCRVDSNKGLSIGNTFDFLFLSALDRDIYTHVVVSIGTYDMEHGLTKTELCQGYSKIRDMYKKAVIVGPYGDVDTIDMETTDGFHFTQEAKEEIGRKLVKYYSTV